MDMEPETKEIGSININDVAFIQGLMNLSFLFLYSLYLQIGRSGTSRSVNSDYVERKIRNILDELVLHVQTMNYLKERQQNNNLINDVQNIEKPKITVTSDVLFSKGGKKKIRVVRRKKSQRIHRGMKGFYFNRSKPPKNKVLLKHYYQPVSRIDDNDDDIYFTDGTYKFKLVRQNNILINVLNSHSDEPGIKRNDYATPDDGNLSWIRSAKDLIEQTHCVAVDIFNIFENANQPPRCLERAICEANHGSQQTSLVIRTLSPFLSVALSWLRKAQEEPFVPDLISAIRAGWIGQPCNLIYHCKLNEKQSSVGTMPMFQLPIDNRRIDLETSATEPISNNANEVHALSYKGRSSDEESSSSSEEEDEEPEIIKSLENTSSENDEHDDNYVELKNTNLPIQTSETPLVIETSTTTTTTMTTIPPGRPRSNLQPDGTLMFTKDIINPQNDNLREKLSSPQVSESEIQDKFVKDAILKDGQEENMLAWHPQSSSFFDVTDAKPGVFYAIDRWSRQSRNSKLLKLPYSL